MIAIAITVVLLIYLLVDSSSSSAEGSPFGDALRTGNIKEAEQNGHQEMADFLLVQGANT